MLHLAPVVQTLDNAIHRINLYPGISIDKTNHAIQWIVIYPVDSVIQPFEQLGPGSNVMRDVHCCVTVDYQQIGNDNIANQIHGFTIDYVNLY